MFTAAAGVAGTACSRRAVGAPGGLVRAVAACRSFGHTRSVGASSGGGGGKEDELSSPWDEMRAKKEREAMARRRAAEKDKLPTSEPGFRGAFQVLAERW